VPELERCAFDARNFGDFAVREVNSSNRGDGAAVDGKTFAVVGADESRGGKALVIEDTFKTRERYGRYPL